MEWLVNGCLPFILYVDEVETGIQPFMGRAVLTFFTEDCRRHPSSYSHEQSRAWLP
jgi:hypothetical protein